MARTKNSTEKHLKPSELPEINQVIVKEMNRQKLSMYELQRKAGIEYAPLYRFVNFGRGLTTPSLHKVLIALGGEIVFK